MNSEIKIGSRVVTRKTGNLGMATVIGIIDSRLYNKLQLVNSDSTWSKLYPDWKEKPVVIIEFDKPQKSISFEEYSNTYANDESFQALSKQEKEYYYERIPVQYFVSTVIDDVEEI